jgi:uncharacterized phage protein gp47/JayE
MQVCAKVYNSFSPTTAQADALTRNVKINGLQRAVSTSSTVVLILTGDANTVILNGFAVDGNGVKWYLPESVTIGSGGSVEKTATSENAGAVEALANSINEIGTPTRGWLTVNNALEAEAGDPIENDADLRIRQSISTMFPSQSVFEGIIATIADLEGVLKHKGYENDTGSTDSDGIPEHSISVVVKGGEEDDIGEAIFNKKTVGCGTYGTTTVNVPNALGDLTPIDFFRPTEKPVFVKVTLQAGVGFANSTKALIQASVAEYLNTLEIGENVYHSKLFCPANLPDSDLDDTYNITEILLSFSASPTLSNDLATLFNELATGDDSDVTIVVT